MLLMFNIKMALEFDEAWPLLNSAAQTGDGIKYEEVKKGLETGEFMFFSRDNSAAVTASAGDTLKIGLAGGKLKELLDIEKEITQYAIINGYKHLEILGRPGWEKSLKQYKKVAVLLRRTLLWDL